MLINKGSVYDLAALYIKLYVGRSINKDELKYIINEFSHVLDIGYTFKDCISILIGNMSIKQNFKLSDIKTYRPQQSRNLLEQSKMYYHKELRIQPKPSVTDVDYNTGTMISTKQEYFVEIAASYTIEELMKYLLSFGYVNTYQWQYSRLKGMMEHYIKKYGIDTVLFMFEAINDNIEEREFDFNKFDNYYQTAKGYMLNIMNNCSTNGGNEIVPRKRKEFM